ncbi:ABC transporter ATP-binding protein [Sphingobium fluviale]|uniref:ATP-binding cassette domain-containing protein n=1 Tax=Sphingobium fluviale TaxID=2506423 RepID=A0A4Q1KMQ9_9SPHN|nr:ATP-binding cassette domain-containing protein [Sphingobium fluviale]RXR30489.1 ATP-binding cassette domain-containing protein [Sphingobium fluviale]
MHMQTNDPSSIVVRARNVTLALGSAEAPVEILRGIDLDIRRGESVAVLGASGSGKSSLMAVLSGLERATNGEVMIGGADFSALDEDDLARARRGHVGIILQAFHLLPTMTALENVAVPLELAGDKQAFDRAARELTAVGLGHRMDHYPAQLSGGEQQRVAIARAMAPGPEILFADEPTGNLDGKTSEAIANLLFQRHKETQATLMLITHDRSLAARCDRIVEISDGRIVDERQG